MILIAFLAGAASTLALPPTNIWPVPFITFPILVWLVDGSSGRLGGVLAAASAGWWFGFGYFLAGLYWLGHAFLVDAKTFGWLLPFAVTALPAAMAIYTALGLALARAIWTRGATRVLALAVALTLAEWLRGHLFSGFPWNTYGYALISPLWLAQGAALIGIWGLTFLAVAIYASPAVLADARTDTRRPWLAPALSVAGDRGACHLRRDTAGRDINQLRRRRAPSHHAAQSAAGRQIQLRAKAAGDEPLSHALRSRAAARNRPACSGVTHLIWPESAFPFFLTREPDVLAQIAALLQGRDGADHGRDPRARYDASGRSRAPRLQFDLRDRARWLDPVGLRQGPSRAVRGIPCRFRTCWSGSASSSSPRCAADSSRATTATINPVPGAPNFLPLVCYEIIFASDAVPDSERPGWLYRHIGRYFDWPFVAGSGERPGWLLNLTNDGWFGASAGPYQHFQQARVRAIEEGLPLVRAANTGISAVVDPFGRVVASLPLGVEGVLDAPLPQPIAPTPMRDWVTPSPGSWCSARFAWVILVRRRRPGTLTQNSPARGACRPRMLWLHV